MIIINKIQIKIGTKNIAYYKNLNYDCNVGDTIIVNSDELMDNSKFLITAKCDVCDNVKQIEYRSYVKNVKKYPTYCCNTSCAKEKENITKKELYGDDYEKIRVQNMKKTNKLKYGNENSSQIFRNEKDKNLFIAQLKSIYKNENYDYSKIEYINNYTKIKVICPSHGDFYIRPIELLAGQGCKKCNREIVRKETLEKCLEKCKNLYNDKYDYSNIIFNNMSDKVKILCPIHGEFEQSLNMHSHNRMCPNCANTERRLKKLILLKQNLKNGFQLSPAFNNKACLIFDDISIKNNIHIQHAMNGGEYHIPALGYWLDGYDIINNVAYEYDEKAHFINGQLKQKDLIRQHEIEIYLNCNFIRIKE